MIPSHLAIKNSPHKTDPLFKNVEVLVSAEKRFKKGDKIFFEGDVLQSFYVLQSGKVSLYLERGGQRTEVDQPLVGHVIGEQGIFNFPRQAFNAEAQSEVKVVELPIDPIKMFFDKSPAIYRLFVKALGDELRRLRGVVKAFKMDQDSTPCPARFIPRLCAILTLVARHIGTAPKFDAAMPVYKQEEERKKNPTFKDDDVILSFNTLKIFTARMFLESPQRMQHFCELLSKLGYLTLKYEKNEDTEQLDLQELRIHDLKTIEMFGEFYQHNFFKAGKSEVIIVDKIALQIAGAFVALAKGNEVDRAGAIKLEYKSLIENLKSKFYIDFKEVHVGLLEKKGLYLKRQTINNVLYVLFDLYEWSSTYKFWAIIQEIDRWNQTGSVNLNENLTEYKAQGPATCPGCSIEIKEVAKFCPECGYKMATAA